MTQKISERRFDQLRPALARLAAEPAGVTTSKIWRALEVGERENAALAVLTDGPPKLRELLISETARLHHFRPKTVASWPDTRIAKLIARRAPTLEPIFDALLLHLHLSDRRDLLADFLDGLGIEHDNGLISGDAPQVDVDPEEVKAAADRLLPLHPVDKVVTYFLSLLATRRLIAAGLEEWLRDFVRTVEREPQAEAELPTEEGESAVFESEPAAAEDTDEFTTLDRLLVRTIVDVAQGIEGALTIDQLDDLLEEVLELNSSRHRTYFHAGLRDAVLGDGPRAELPASNATRRRWYWTGFVQGLARRGRWQEIVEFYDREPTVRELGSPRHGTVAASSAIATARAAAPHVVEALCRHGRAGEAAGFIDVSVAISAPGTFRLLESEAEKLLRQDKPAEARAVYDLLVNALEHLSAGEIAEGQRRFLEVRRRRAHCFRQLGELNYARQLLTELLEEEPDSEIRAMVLTDLGLIDGGFRRLGDLSIPLDEDRLESFAAAVERGVPQFTEAMNLEVRYSAHARYCMGIRAFVKRLYTEAVDHLQMALSVFESEPDRYGPGNLLLNARLYLGLALCLDVHPGRMKRAAELIREAISAGAQLPRYLIDNTLEALGLSSSAAARETAELILDVLGDEVLDRLLASEACRDSERIARALFERARDTTRPERARIQDYRNAIPMLIRHGYSAEAAEALDYLESAAFRGTGRDEFIEILKDPDRFSPVWDMDDAQWALVRCYEASGRYEEAANILGSQFHRVLSQNNGDGIGDAEAILRRIREYGLPDNHYAPLLQRLEALKKAHGEELALPSGKDRRRVRILFVGGDERQAQYDAAIKADLERDYPHITVDFCHTGWGSQWGRTLEDVRRRLQFCDGVVISQYIRTEFGRQLRKSLEVPWRGCYGSGKQAIVHSIVQLAQIVERASASKN